MVTSYPVDAGELDVRLQRCGRTAGRTFDLSWPALRHAVVVHLLRGRIVCLLDSTERLTVSAGQTLVVAAGTPHRISTDTGDVEYLWAHLTASVHGAFDLARFYRFPPFVEGARSRRIRSLLHKIINAARQRTVAAAARRGSFAYALCGELLAAADPRPVDAVAIERVPHLRDVLRHVAANLHLPLDRAALAAMLNLSPSRFTEVFRRATGSAPMQYVKNARLRRAQELLARGDMGLKQVAAKAGFCDEYHLSRQFLAAFGLRPGAYRRKVGMAMEAYRGGRSAGG